MLLDGLHIPLTTPFHPDGRINLPKLAANVVRYSKSPAAGLIALGPSGEPTLLSDDETRETLRTVAEAAAPEKVLIAGIARDSVRATLDLAAIAAELHYDAILVGAPTIAFGPRELLNYFQIVGDRSPLPIIMLSAASALHALPVDIIDVVAALATHPNILGLLTADSANITDVIRHTAAVRRDTTVTPTFTAVTARMRNAAVPAAAPLISPSALTGNSSTAIAEPPALPALRTRTKSVGFQILASQTPELLAGLHAGAAGIAPAFAACAPQACYEVFAAWKDGDQSLAEEKQSRIREAALLAEAAPGTLKFACELNGYFGGLPRLPHLPPTGEQRTALEQLMKPLRN